jgi:hypothetical protein
MDQQQRADDLQQLDLRAGPAVVRSLLAATV